MQRRRYLQVGAVGLTASVGGCSSLYGGFEDDEDASTRWAVDLPDALFGPPSVADGDLLIPTEDGLVSLDGGTGEQRWRLDEQVRDFAVDGQWLFTVVGDDPVLTGYDRDALQPRWQADDVGQRFTLESDGLYTAAGDGIRAFDRDGTRRWHLPDEGGDLPYFRRLDGQLLAQHTLGTGSAQRTGIHLAGLDPVAWHWSFEDPHTAEALVSRVDQQLIVGQRRDDSPATVRSIGMDDGSIRWEHETEYEVAEPVTVGADPVLVSAFGGAADWTAGLDSATGDALWETDDWNATVYEVGGAVIARDSSGTVAGLSPDDGTERWRYEPARSATVSGSDLMPLTDVLVVTEGDSVVGLDGGSGAERWRFDFEVSVDAVVPGEGDLYVVVDGTVRNMVLP